MIYILNKQQQIISTLSNKGDMKKVVPYFEDMHIEELDTGVETFEFKTLSNTKVSNDIQIGNYIAFKDENYYKIFQIKEIQEQHTEQIEKSVYCEGACLELLNEVVRPMTINAANLKQFLNTVLEGTSWSIGIIDECLNEVIHIDISDYENVYKIIQETVIEKFGGELRFRVEIANNRIVSKNIDVFAKRGSVTNYRFEYGVNMTSVEKVVDSSELVTALIGVGKDNLTFKDAEAYDKPKSQDFVASEDAYNRWNNNGCHIMGVFNCESESPQELLKLTRDELKRRSEPKITYNLEVELLGNDVSLGDEVLVIDNEFIPPLHLSARVSVLEKSKTDKQSNKCTLSNFKEIKSNINSEMRTLASKLEEKVDDKINKVTIGGRNLVRNSDFASDKYWTLDSFALIDSEILLDNVNSICLKKTEATSNNLGGIKQTVIKGIKKDDMLTVSGYYFLKNKALLDGSFACELKGNYEGGTSTIDTYLSWSKDDCVQGTWTKFSYTAKATRDFIDAYLYGWISKNGEVWFAKLQVEKGNKVSDWTPAPEDIYGALVDTENNLKKDINNSIDGAKEGFLESAKENFTEKSEFNTFTKTVSSKFEQTSSDISAKFTESINKTELVNGKLEDFQETVTTHIQFDNNGINLGKTNSPFTATLDNTKLAFKQDGDEVAYISNNKMYITHAEIKDILRVGKPDSTGNTDGGFFTWIQGSNGNLSLKWSAK
ncbi:phage tail spike protein [Romboutsia sp.]|uniref:phage tail spike protein n=1 Tax=Romboutsia sp. TaxID=1965302 RepID=UPI003F2C8DC0